MSIISDALKKAQQKKNSSVEKEEITPAFFERPQPSFTSHKNTQHIKPKNPKLFPKIAFIVIPLFIFSISTILLLPLIKNFIPKTSNPAAKALINKKNSASGKTGSLETPAPGQVEINNEFRDDQSPPANTIKRPIPELTGIMYSDTNPKAILNGRILDIGEDVNGYTVSSISKDKVTLKHQQNDSLVELNLR